MYTYKMSKAVKIPVVWLLLVAAAHILLIGGKFNVFLLVVCILRWESIVSKVREG